MPIKMIPFPFEIKIIPSDFCDYDIYNSDKDRQSGSFFFILFFYFYYYGIRMHGVA